MVIGDKRKFLSALVTVDPDNIAEFANENGITFKQVDELLTNDKVIKMITGEVAEKNKNFAKFETIKKITLVPEFTVENKMMTPTFKVKKNVAMAEFQNKIDAMYPKD
jgi:long-chain acyl-CoA synthetase